MSLRRWAQPVVLLGIGALAIIYCTTAYLIVSSRHDAAESARRQGENLARIIAESYTHVFQSVDATLLNIRAAYLANPRTFDIVSQALNSFIQNEMAFDFTFANQQGRIVDATSSLFEADSRNSVDLDISDRDYFQAQRDASQDNLLISKPVVLKASGKRAIVLARRVTGADGKFAGIVSALIDPTALARITGNIDLGPGGTFGLVGLDGTVRARVTNGVPGKDFTGHDLPPDASLLPRASQSRTGNYWSTPGVFDAFRRFVSYRVLGSYPMIATVTSPESEIFRRANDDLRNYVMIAIILTVAVFIAVAYGVKRERKLSQAMAQMKRAQSAMRQSQERYRLVEDAVNDGIWDFDVVAGTGYRSPRWAEILGYGHDDLSPTSLSFREMLHPDDKARAEVAIRAHLEEDKPYDIEFRLRHKNGDYRWVHSRGKAVRDEAGRAIRMLGAITDIGERKRAEALIEESFNNLARAEALTRMGHYKYDVTTNSYGWSDGLYKIMDKSRDTFTPSLETTMALVHPDDRPILERYRRDVMAGLNVSTVTTRGIKDDGSIVHVELWSAPIRSPDGTVTGLFGTSRDVTARVKAEAAVKESRDNLARAEAMAGLGHYKYELGTDVYTWSDGAFRIYGKSRDAFAPTLSRALEIFCVEDRRILEQYRREVLAGHDVLPVTLRATRDDGKKIIVEFWSQATRTNSGKVNGFFGTIKDVTEQKQAEAAIKESHDNLARAEAMVLLGHYKYEKAAGNIAWSRGIYRIMGQSPATFTPTPESVVALFHPEDRPALLQHRQDVLAGLSSPHLTARVLKDDGQIAFVHCWSTPVRDAGGNITGYFGTAQDVTERKQAEDTIEESLANLRRAERLALLGHYKIDRDTGRLAWSHGIYRIFGLSAESYTPTLHGVLELIHPDDRHILTRFRDDAMAGQEVPHATLRALRSDGRTIDVEYWSTPVRDGDGNIIGVFGTLQDVTLRKRAEDALALANHELETRVQQHTAELAVEMRRREEAQMTLGQMQKMEAVGQLTAGIAHDFNNLLAVIGGGLEFVDQAAARGLTADPELIDAALRATRRGGELVRRLLAFSRQSPLRAEPTVINQLVLDTLRLLQRTLGQGIDMVTRLDADAALISVDRNQMANALLNLALNARDAMPEGGQLTIATDCRPSLSTGGKATARSPKGEDICITISDTGTGMTDDVRKRAFEPFFTTKPDGLGSGLGLSMVQGFVEQSGGQIDIDSEPGRGTTITIRLPRIAATDAADDSELARGTTGTARNKTVLLVEDDPDVRVITAAQLKNLGYRVHAVANGMEAIDLIASPANIDITLTDIVLPGGFDGVELIKEAMRARPNMGVLCMSGYDPTQKHRKWLQVQNINFLQKPFTSSRLAQALDAALVH